jgi:hypothetical protein
LTTYDPARRDPSRSDHSAAAKRPGLGTLTVMAASALLVPESAMAQGAFGPGAPPPVAAPRTPPAPPPVIAPQAPMSTPNFGTQPGPMAPSAIAPKANGGNPITLNGGDFGAVTAPTEAKGSGQALTIYGNPSAVTAPSATTPPQKPSSSDGKR